METTWDRYPETRHFELRRASDMERLETAWDRLSEAGQRRDGSSVVAGCALGESWDRLSGQDGSSGGPVVAGDYDMESNGDGLKSIVGGKTVRAVAGGACCSEAWRKNGNQPGGPVSQLPNPPECQAKKNTACSQHAGPAERVVKPVRARSPQEYGPDEGLRSRGTPTEQC